MQDSILSEYVNHWLFLQQRNKKLSYDCIITQEPFLPEHTPPCKVIVLDKNNLYWSLANALASCEHPLVLLQTLSLPTFISLACEKKEITIVSLSAWYSSMWTVTFPFLQDIPLAITLWYHVYEPYDTVSLFAWLEQPWKVYVRLTNELLPDILPLPYKEILPLRESVIWSSTALLFSWSFLPTAVRVVDILEKEWKNVSSFLMSHLNFSSFVDTKEFFQWIEQLIVVLDQQGWWYEQYIKSKLYEARIYVASLHFLYPRYELLTTVLPEYQSQQLAIDPEWLVARITPLL